MFSFYDDRIDKHMPDHNDDSQEPDFAQKTFAMRLDHFKDKTNWYFSGLLAVKSDAFPLSYLL